MLLEYRESINTECRVERPTLTTQAIKIDANRHSLKQKVECGLLKSCDYFKKRDNKLYFIEVSDFNAQMEDLSKKSTSKEAKQYIKMEVRLKLFASIQIIPYMEIEQIFQKKRRRIQKII